MRKPDFIIPGYLHRWYAWPKRQKHGNAALHHILAPDPGTDRHDHAAWSISIVLWGWYTEQFEDGSRRLMFPGRIACRPATQLHRISEVSNSGCWTIWIRGTHERKWGFQTVDGWVPWDEYENLERAQ